MRLALQVIAYDVNRYINSMLRNAAPFVDKIFIAYSHRPWGYIEESRETRTNPTSLEYIDVEGLPCEIEVIHGDWERDEDTRNACLVSACQQGFDWMVVQDADEFYTEQSWEQLRQVLKKNRSVPAFKTTWYQFWKSSEFVLLDETGCIKGRNALFAIQCRKGLRFERSRSPNLGNVMTVDIPCYHYGWVKSDEEMYRKVTQWSHAHQINGERWYLLKWLLWNPQVKNLWPHYPKAYPKAVRFPLHQPLFAEEFILTVKKCSPTILQNIENLVYDFEANGAFALRNFKRFCLPNSHLRKVGLTDPEVNDRII